MLGGRGRAEARGDGRSGHFGGWSVYWPTRDGWRPEEGSQGRAEGGVLMDDRGRSATDDWWSWQVGAIAHGQVATGGLGQARAAAEGRVGAGA